MSIDYVRPARKTVKPVQQPQPAPVTSKARTELRYWVEQYNKLTAQILAAQVTNADPWRKEHIDTRKLYSLRAAAAACMAAFAVDVLDET